MAVVEQSSKHAQITKANARLVVVVCLAAVITTFSIVASRAILVKRNYQARVIHEKEKASKQLKENIKAVDSLAKSYEAFIDQPENIIGGDSKGNGERDGDNAKIVLDALPSIYDFPALTTSLEKILKNNNYVIGNISGTDDEIAQKTATATSTEPVSIPFQVGVSGSYSSLQELIDVLERSIRPMHLKKLSYTSGESGVLLSVDAKTFYQPEKKLKINTKAVQ